ncbi:ABC transporter substrate-binding protein [Treponema sp. TIM-1]|uniref:ABC transporter substrate-binding protein n=1 Tax=Treponema sp. TIM-1 TaxID=2898417 RepID=UPI0039811F38
MKSRIFLFGIVLSLSVFVLLSCSEKKDAAASAAPTQGNVAETPFVVRVGVDSHAFSFQFRVAEQTGIFDKHNVDAELFTFSYGIDTINAAILGETDSAEAMDFAAASRFSESNKLRILATITTANPDGSHLYTRNDAIKTPSDLKGKRIGVQKATANEFLWARLFEKYNLKKEEVNHIYLGSNAELLAAYQSNEIDAFWVGADLEKAVNEIPSSRDIGNVSLAGYLQRGFLLLDADLIARNPAGVERFLKALDEATTFIKEKPEETARIAYEDLKLPVDAALKSIEAQNYELRLTQEDLDQITSVAEWSYANGLFRNKYNIKDYIDPVPLRNVLPDRVTVQ